MNFGKMDRRITHQVFGESRDAEGGLTKTWSTGTTVWAQVIQKGGKEIFTHDHVNEDVDTLFRIRYTTDLTPTVKDRIQYGSDFYNIINVKELGRGSGYELMGKLTVT